MCLRPAGRTILAFGNLPGSTLGRILRLENSRNVKSFRIIDLNPAAALLTGAKLEDFTAECSTNFRTSRRARFPTGALGLWHARRNERARRAAVIGVDGNLELVIGGRGDR